MVVRLLRSSLATASASVMTAALVLCSACVQSHAVILEDAWRAQVASETADVDDGGAPSRRGRVLALFEAGQIRGPRPSFWAAYVLVTSNEVPTLELARDLAFAAASDAEGDTAVQALPIAAQAVDRLLIRRRRPQRYGTQVAFDPELGRWILAPTEETTTDEERRTMYLPTLAEQRLRAERMNDS